MNNCLRITGSAYCVCLLAIGSVSAKTTDDVVGWHWYNEPVEHPIQKPTPHRLLHYYQKLSPTQQLNVLRQATNRLKDKAILSGKVADIAAYKRAQDFWVRRATQFTIGWERMLLHYPALNYALRFSHENGLAAIAQRQQHQREDHAVTALARSNGLLFFYRGKDAGDRHFASVLKQYSTRYHLALIPVSVDGESASVFKSTRLRGGVAKASALGIHYFPALVLVNPKRKQHTVVSYGFKSEAELSDRLLKIADGWQANF